MRNKEIKMNYYICSVGEPGKKYDDENVRQCMTNSGFFIHPHCKQKGSINDISEGDVLILKYKGHFFAYGRAVNCVQEISNGGWDLKVPVNGWITGVNIDKKGIQAAQLTGNNYATVKHVDENFAKDTIKSIGFPF